MRILITNDDGVHAPGLALMERIAKIFSDDIFVVAPEHDQSGVSHSLTINDPLRLRKISERHFAVKGTPTDCVIMGVRKLLQGRKPDLVLCGVNNGHNVADDLPYSGTVAGAMEAASLGLPAIALSQAYGPIGHEESFWDCAETHAPGLIRQILGVGVPPFIVINVNFPPCPPDSVQGLMVSAQARCASGRHRRTGRWPRKSLLLDFFRAREFGAGSWHRPRSLGAKQNLDHAAQTRFDG
jgi:5'-nucleotidase